MHVKFIELKPLLLNLKQLHKRLTLCST